MTRDNLEKEGPPAHVLSIGHSNQALDTFVGLVLQHGVQVLLDVRSQPYSKFAPQFNGRTLPIALKPAGIKYLYLGKELGGRPEGDEYYDAEGHVRYDRVAQSDTFLEGIDRLERGVRGNHRIAVMCSEEDPIGCHRRLLIGCVLAERQIEMVHIRGDGRLESEAEVRRRESPAGEDARQLALFPEIEEEPWRSVRSIRSASPSGEPPSSSKR